MYRDKIYLTKRQIYENGEKIKMNLQERSTSELVEELTKREAVEQFIAEPYQAYKISIGENETANTGPVVILRIRD